MSIVCENLKKLGREAQTAFGRIEWLEKANALVTSGEDCSYAAFMSTIDVLVMGRNARTLGSCSISDAL
jgi:hypothetical protein